MLECCDETSGVVLQLQVASILNQASISYVQLVALQIQFDSMRNSMVLATKLFIFDSIQYQHFPRQRAIG